MHCAVHHWPVAIGDNQSGDASQAQDRIGVHLDLRRPLLRRCYHVTLTRAGGFALGTAAETTLKATSTTADQPREADQRPHLGDLYAESGQT